MDTDMNLAAETIADAPVEPKPKTKRAKKPKGASLRADMSGHAPGVLQQRRYWVGIFPNCPVECIDVAGVNFPKVNEDIVDNPLNPGGPKTRVPVIGTITFLSKAQIALLNERIPLVVVRFLNGEQEEHGTGENRGDAHLRRRGHLITIPNEQQMASPRNKRRYIQRSGDEPAADFMFAHLCEDQENGKCGQIYPESLAETGLEWTG